MYVSKFSRELSSVRLLWYRDFAVLAILLIASYLIHDFMAPLLVGFIFSVVLYPVYKKFSPMKLPKSIRAFCVTTLFALIFLLPIVGLIYAGADAALDAISKFRGTYFGESAKENPSELIDRWLAGRPLKFVAAWVPINEEGIRDVLSRSLAAGGQGLANGLRAIVGGLPKALVSIIIILLATYFGLSGGREMVEFLRTRSPFSYENTQMLFKNVRNACHSSIVASAIAGLLQAIILVVTSLLVTVPYVWVVGLASFLLSFIPMIGTSPLTASVCLYLLLKGEAMRAVLFLIGGMVAGISDNVVRPYVLQGSARIPALAGLVFTFGAIGILGFSGLFLGPVVAGLLFTLAGMHLSGDAKSRSAKAYYPLQECRD